MPEDGIYYIWAVLLFLANSGAWASNLFVFPGNWVIVVLTALFALFVPGRPDETLGVSWTVVGIIVLLAVLGEVVEFAAGAAGAARRGGSRRSMLLAVVGAAVGSLIGATLTLPIVLIGPIIGALVGGGLGAFVGAYLGEVWVGRSTGESLDIGKAAFIGRLLGTAGKMAIGAIMLVIVTIDSFL